MMRWSWEVRSEEVMKGLTSEHLHRVRPLADRLSWSMAGGWVSVPASLINLCYHHWPQPGLCWTSCSKTKFENPPRTWTVERRRVEWSRQADRVLRRLGHSGVPEYEQAFRFGKVRGREVRLSLCEPNICMPASSFPTSNRIRTGSIFCNACILLWWRFQVAKPKCASTEVVNYP